MQMKLKCIIFFGLYFMMNPGEVKETEPHWEPNQPKVKKPRRSFSEGKECGFETRVGVSRGKVVKPRQKAAGGKFEF
jgi:hypothetical protein